MKYKVFLREIKVTPVIIEADSIEEAQSLIKEGDGEYQNDESVYSDLNASDFFNPFENPTEIVP